MDTGLRDLLHDLATEMPIDVEGAPPRTLRRARTRRALSAAGAAMVAVALVAVGVSALRLVADPRVPATTAPDPGAPAFAGLWPETDAEALAEAQAAVDEGHSPLRTTPDGTAQLLATGLLGWQPTDIEWRAGEPTGPEGPTEHAIIELSNRSFGASVPRITVELRQLGDTGPGGIWSVVAVSTPLIELREASGSEGSLRLSGSLSNLFDGAPTLDAYVLADATPETAVASGSFELGDRQFDFELQVEPTPDGRGALLLTMPDATGASLGAVMRAVETPVGELPPSEPDVTGVPPDVAVTAQRIYDAASAGDVDALAELVDPNVFIHELGDASDPIPSWRADPSVLELMVAILELPPTTREIEGMGTFTFWPYLVNSDLTSLSEQERADLAALGFTEQEIDVMVEGGHGYQGPRLAIDEQGVWRNFLTAGE